VHGTDTPPSELSGPGEASLAWPGWRVALAAHFGVMVSFGSLLVFTFGIFLKPLSEEFGWSREAISGAFGIGAMMIAVASPILGRLIDRLGPRAVVLPCMAIFGLAFTSLAFLTPNLWHLYAVFAVLGLVGNGTTQLGYSGAVSSWFTARRGIALAIVVGGVGVGSIILPVVAERVIAVRGWRAAYLTLGGLIFLLGLPLSWRYLRMRPRAAAAAAAADGSEGSTVPEALRTRGFWIIAITLFIGSIAANGALTHMAAMLDDRGIGASGAALAASALGGASLAGRFLAGWLLDRFNGPIIAMLMLMSMAAGVLLLSQAHALPIGVGAAVLIGLGMGGEANVTPYLISRYFGPRSLSTLYGLTWTFYAFAGAIGPVLMGRAFDATGSYERLMILTAVPMLVSGLLFLLMPRYPGTASPPRSASVSA
jgi:MFS family permease